MAPACHTGVRRRRHYWACRPPLPRHHGRARVLVGVPSPPVQRVGGDERHALCNQHTSHHEPGSSLRLVEEFWDRVQETM